MDGLVATPDALIAHIAERQHGAISVAQLRGVGVSEDAVRARMFAGRLHRVHRGVYAVGHKRLSPQGRWLAAVLAAGGGPSEEDESVFGYWRAAVSHRSAAQAWGLLALGDGPIDVIVMSKGGRVKRRGMRVHRSRSIAPSDVTLRDGIPVTTPARTVADLRRAASEGRSWALAPRDLRRVIRQADVIGLPVGDEVAADRTRSDLESDFLEVCRRYGLPQPEVNVRIGPFLVDFLWPERRVVVETDSYLYHRGKVAFQDDRARDLDLRRRGYQVLHLSEQQVNEEPEEVAGVLHDAVGEKAVKVGEKPSSRWGN
jgi:very-short-patch-repair endonuclease